MALHPDFPESPFAILNPAVRWYMRTKAPVSAGVLYKQIRLMLINRYRGKTLDI